VEERVGIEREQPEKAVSRGRRHQLYEK
jgi:hypothetical protein